MGIYNMYSALPFYNTATCTKLELDEERSKGKTYNFLWKFFVNLLIETLVQYACVAACVNLKARGSIFIHNFLSSRLMARHQGADTYE